MDFSEEAIRVAVILLPGFLAVAIRDFFLPKRRAGSLDRFMEVVAFSVAVYLVARTLGGDAFARSTLMAQFYWLGATALAAGLGVGVIVGRDLHYRWARKLRLMHRTGRDDVWQDVFSDFRGNWIQVHMEGGLRAIGWAEYYSDFGAAPSMFLRQAEWVESDGERTAVDGPGLLVCELARIRYVEFLGPGEGDKT